MISKADDATFVRAARMPLLKRRRVLLPHVLKHSVQRGVEESRRAAALRPQRHQLRALGQAGQHCQGRETERREGLLLDGRTEGKKKPSSSQEPTVGGGRNGAQPVHADLGQLLQQLRLPRQLGEEAAALPHADPAGQQLSLRREKKNRQNE